jgi:hypothetical protein
VSASTKNIPVEVVAYSSDAEGRVRFHLRQARIIEICYGFKWFASRARIAKALKYKASTIEVGLLKPVNTSKTAYVFRANRPSIQIGCMRFSGENAKKLRQWAEGKRA